MWERGTERQGWIDVSLAVLSVDKGWECTCVSGSARERQERKLAWNCEYMRNIKELNLNKRGHESGRGDRRGRWEWKRQKWEGKVWTPEPETVMETGIKKKEEEEVGSERNVFTSLHRQRRHWKCKSILKIDHFYFELPKYTVEKQCKGGGDPHFYLLLNTLDVQIGFLLWQQFEAAMKYILFENSIPQIILFCFCRILWWTICEAMAFTKKPLRVISWWCCGSCIT